MDVLLRCACGAIEGRVTRTEVATRALCYCTDCQAAARLLGEPGRILDDRGGTDIVATLPRHLVFTRGIEHLRCLSLSARGLLRWHCDRCRTPVGNTPRDPKTSYVGIVRTCLAGSASEIDAAFGPARIVLNAKSATVPVASTPLALTFSILRIMGNLLERPDRRADDRAMSRSARRACVAGVIGTLLATCALADCKAEGPLATARWVFEHAYHFADRSAPDAGDYLSPALLGLLDKEWRCKATGAACALTVDPWTEASEGEAADPIVFSLVASPVERRRVAIRYVFDGEPARSELSLVQDATTQCWLVDDLAGRKNTSIRRRLQQQHRELQ